MGLGAADPEHLKRLTCAAFCFNLVRSNVQSHWWFRVLTRMWNSCLRCTELGVSWKCSPGQEFKYQANSVGNPLCKTSTGVDIFLSLIFPYFRFFVAAFSPCHGRLVLPKYIKTCPDDSMSSLKLFNTKTCTDAGILGSTSEICIFSV